MIVYLRLRCLHSVLFRHARSFICEHGFREISGTSQVHGTEKRIRWVFDIAVKFLKIIHEKIAVITLKSEQCSSTIE